MKYYNKLKFFVRCSLIFGIVFLLFNAFEAMLRNNIFVLFLSCGALFLFIIPLYYAVYLLEKQKQQLNDVVNDSFNYIHNIIKDDDVNLKNDFENKISNDKDLELFYTHLIENKDLLLDLKKKDKLLNEILISTVVNNELDKFLADVMPRIMNITESQFIVFYVANKITNKLEIKSSIGFSKNIYSQFDIGMGEGFLGQAAINNKIIVVKDLNHESVYVSKTFLGDIAPKNIVAVPVNDVNDENDILGVFAIGSMYEYKEKHIEILEEIRKYTSYAIINGVFYSKTVRLTNELKFQNQLIQNLNEDLEQKIKERTVSLNNILNSIRAYTIISIDMEKNISMLNDGAVEKFEISRDNFIGKKISEIPKIDDYIYDKNIDCIDVALKTGKYIHIHRFEDDFGKEHIDEVELFSIKNELGEISGVTIVMKEISFINKVNSLQVFDKKIVDTILEDTSDLVIIVTSDFIIEEVSKNVEYLIGMSRQDLRGKIIDDIFIQKEDVRKFVKNILNGGDVKNFNAILKDSKISVTMKAKVIFDDFNSDKKIIIYL